MLFCGNEGLDGERKAMRHAMIVENLQQLYTDVFNDWVVANEQGQRNSGGVPQRLTGIQGSDA